MKTYYDYAGPTPQKHTSLRDPAFSVLQRSLVVGRYLVAILFLIGFMAKVWDGWLWSDALRLHFTARLADPPAISEFQRSFLSGFAIPNYFPLGWIVTAGELPIGLGLLFAVQIRLLSVAAIIMLLGFAAGGYVDMSTWLLIAFALVMVLYPIKRNEIESLDADKAA